VRGSKIYITAIVFGICANAILLQAQDEEGRQVQVENIEKVPVNKLLKFGDNSIEKGDVYTAIKFYETYCNKKFMDHAARYKLATLCYQAKYYNKAYNYFKEVYDADPKTYPLAHLYFAEIMMMRGQYKEAKEEFKVFRKEYRGRDYSKKADNHMDGCDMAIENKDKPINVDINHLNSSINRGYIEFSPVIKDNGTLIFGSLPSDTMPSFNPRVENITYPYRRLYQAKRVKDLDWEYMDTLDGPFHDNISHSGNGVFSVDRKRFYFSKCVPDWQNKVKCHIYISNHTDSGWSKPEYMPYPINLVDYSSSMPAVGIVTKRRAKLEVLYFVSDRPFRNQGGRDIYYSVQDPRDSTFDRVDNVGRRINTPGNEITPFYDVSTGTMFFSTDYLPGYGGYDIFKIKGRERRWKRPENAGQPFNSGYDDLYFTRNPFQRAEGFFYLQS
jgi:hypothetical protein